MVLIARLMLTLFVKQEFKNRAWLVKGVCLMILVAGCVATLLSQAFNVKM